MDHFIIIIIIIIIALTALFVIAESRRELHNFRVKRYECRYDSHVLKDEFNVCLISDLHGNEFGVNNVRLVKAIIDTRPDIILIPGDLITGGYINTYYRAMHFLTELSASYYKEMDKSPSDVSIFVSLGNHEAYAFRRYRKGHSFSKMISILEQKGIRFLDNESYIKLIKNNAVRISGISISAHCYAKFSKGRITYDEVQNDLLLAVKNCAGLRTDEMTSYYNPQKAERRTDEIISYNVSDETETEIKTFNICLSHHPDTGKLLNELGENLVVSGHYHGGLVRLPLIGGILTPQLPSKNTHTRGSFIHENGYTVVSAGLGWHTIPIRLFNPCEIVSIDITKS